MEPQGATPRHSSLAGWSSKDASSTGKPAPEVVFITADASGSKESRQAIRRRAAQHSHRVGRKKPKTKKQKLEEELEKAGLMAEDRPQFGSSAVILPLREVNGNASDPAPSTGTESSTLSSTFSDSNRSSSGEPDFDETIPVQYNSTHLQLHKSHVSSVLIRHSLKHRDSITTSSYPVPMQAWYPELLEYMWAWMGQSWEAMDTTSEERDRALRWVQYVTMSEPSYFYMNMLSVADALQDRNMIEPQKVLWLGGQVVKAINSALSDPARMQSAGVILTVGRIALEEIVSGNRETGERFHRPAQARLIAMTGGLDALGLPSLVKKHVMWADRVMQRITDLSMTDLNPGVNVDTRLTFGPQPMDRDLELLNKYRPQRRRKHGDI